jgi:DNA-binding response OmpR family regulator
VVIEPDDLILGLLERWLHEAGYSVMTETSQNLAQAVSESGEPDLVIVDVPAPRNAGGIIRSVQEVCAAPILLLSARFRRDTGSSRALASQLGVRSVLPKPFTRRELLSAVSESIEGP